MKGRSPKKPCALRPNFWMRSARAFRFPTWWAAASSCKKQGREWAGLSPFNKEKTPSFFVNDQKGFYHCFSSGKNGDIFRFLMETEGVTFPEAVERLAGMAGVDVPKSAPEEVERAQRRRQPGRCDGDGRAVLRGEPRRPDRSQRAGLSRPARPLG